MLSPFPTVRMKHWLRSLIYRGNVRSTLKWDIFVINSFFGFQILQLGMMGTSVLYSSGDTGIAGGGNNTYICLNSRRMSWAPWSAILLCFDICCMKIEKLFVGQSLTHHFLYVQTWFLSFPMTHCFTSVYMSVCNIRWSNPNETRIYGRWPGSSCDGLLF